MRLRIFFVSALLLAGVRALACGPYWYYPEDYFMFRVYDKEMMRSLDTDRNANCAAWRTLAGGKAYDEDIRQVVYKYSLDQLNGILKGTRSKNSFARYIATSRDSEIADFLVLAKTCELSRSEMNDPWYYPSKDDPTIASLEDVIDRSLSYSGERLEDRYVLQAIRAMFSLERFGQIDSLWMARESHLKEGVIKNMARGYVAGAAYNLGQKDKALNYYMENEDLMSLRTYYPQFGSDMDILGYAAQNCPDNPEVSSFLQDVGSRYEREYNEEQYSYSREEKYKDIDGWVKDAGEGMSKEIREYIQICLKGARNAKEPGMWYYAASFLYDCLGDGGKAMDYIAKAEQSRKSQFIDESVKVLRMYLDAKYLAYDTAYEARLFEQIKWLDGKIASCITPNVKTITSEGYDLHLGFSYYYWNDMLRKVLIGYAAPKMDKINPVLSLRLRNMADNRILNLVDCYSTEYYDGKWHWNEPKIMTMKEYRADTGMENMFDYSNYFFDAMDSLELKAVIRYEKSMGNGVTEMDRYLDSRGYVSHDYVRELIGTRYLRERNYSEALKYLSDVSGSYENTTNVHWYFNREPFSYGPVKGKELKRQYKLTFAKEMVSLEARMKSDNPDTRGAAMVRYGLGLRSSFDNCWALTQYHLNCEDVWQEEPYRIKALEDAEDYIKSGLRTIKDPETAALNYSEVCLWQSVLEKFPGTKVAQEIRTQCDKLVDYRYGKSRDRFWNKEHTR